jgi:colanic acid/amylovoran biosynthesis protein
LELKIFEETQIKYNPPTMTIQIDGTNTVNKGAELMLYTVLERLEQHYSEARIIYVPNIPRNYIRIDTGLSLHERKILRYSRYPEAVLRRLQLPRSYFTTKYPRADLDVVLDAGGFQFSDQWGYPFHFIDLLENYYKKLHASGCKIIFLPQAFGPFESAQGKRTVEIINAYAHLIIAREQVSYDHLIAAGADPAKVRIYPDFTLAVSGTLPENLLHLKNKVCIILNKKMITHTRHGAEQYLEVMQALIQHCVKNGKDVFLLNHEGEGDLQLCHKLNAVMQDKLEVVTGLNAKQIKGVIGQAYMVISSRFHGVASALSQAVPCLSTSWNHKYKMLFKDYQLEDRILSMESTLETLKNQVDTILNTEKNAAMRTHLATEKQKLNVKINTMWEEVFDVMGDI